MKAFISGNEAAVRGAIAAGARGMFGYPITPSTEILQGWSDEFVKDPSLKFIQTEDETAAGFVLNGAILEGMKSFTATSGPGTVLMQDPLSMAENLRIPSVTIVMQRGGPSTGQVNFSQQEVMLACFGGNGEGLRIVYSAGSPQEMYDYTIKAFNSAWKFQFPTLLLGDGYIGKQKTLVNLTNPINPVKSFNLLDGKNLKNCYSSEAEFAIYLNKNIKEFEKVATKIEESSFSGLDKAKTLVIAHGSTFYNVKEALSQIDPKGAKFALFRPITLRPFPKNALNKALQNRKKLVVIESSFGQLERIAKDAIDFSKSKIDIRSFYKPAEGFLIEEIIEFLEQK
jgi:2-oxoglutarate ferredoxin oxidoreductase subunit alpha